MRETSMSGRVERLSRYRGRGLSKKNTGVARLGIFAIGPLARLHIYAASDIICIESASIEDCMIWHKFLCQKIYEGV